MTAGHTILNASKEKVCGIGFKKEMHWNVATWVDSEVNHGYDVAFVKVKLPTPPKYFEWSFDELDLLSNVQSWGFPHAYDIVNSEAGHRALKGYVVAAKVFHGCSGKPRSYELSFPAPEGLSGAPLIDERSMQIKGIVVGTSSIETPISLDKIVERTVSTGGTIEKTESEYRSFCLGIAIQSKSLKDIKSRLLGGSLYEYLRS